MEGTTVGDKVCQDVASISGLLSCVEDQVPLAEASRREEGWRQIGGFEKLSLHLLLFRAYSSKASLYQTGLCWAGVFCHTCEGRWQEGGREAGGKQEDCMEGWWGRLGGGVGVGGMGVGALVSRGRIPREE